jgi:hypothetical protein
MLRAAGLAVLLTTAAQPAHAAGPADSPPASSPAAAGQATPQGALVLVDEKRTETVIVVEKEAKPEPRPPAWEYLERGLLFYPEGPGAGKDRWAIGGLWQVAPMFTANYRRGLGAGFTFDAALMTIILYNQLGVGAEWSTRAGPFSLGLMLHTNLFFGALGKAFVQTNSFDATGWGVLIDPGVKAGLQVTKDAWLTLAVEGYWTVYQASNLGGLVLSPDSASWTGGGATLVVEYSPKRTGVIYYGVSLYHTATNYPFWFNVEASPTGEPFNSKKVWYLGVLAGYEF